MNTHTDLVNFIWNICNLLRGPYKRNEYRKVILPLSVLRRFDCILAPTKTRALEEYKKIKTKPKALIKGKMGRVTKLSFYNTSKMDFGRLLDAPDDIAKNLNSYINAFSPNVREIMDKFSFAQQVAKMHDKNLLYKVVQEFAKLDLSAQQVDNIQMGYVFEELIRIGAEQSNEEAGEHFTPREVIILMVELLLSTEKDLAKSRIVKTVYDPACGTGGMLSVAQKHIKDLNEDAITKLYGQDWNDEAWAVCKSDMLIKGDEAENIILGDTFTRDGFGGKDDGERWTFDYMLANPPFGVEWKQQEQFIKREKDRFGYGGRFGAGLPRINDGALLFLQHMVSKMRRPEEGGSRIGIVFNGSPLFTGDAGQGESEIRRWVIENDMLEAVIALPEQLFYNTGIATYIWILSNKKEKKRRGKIQLIDARDMWLPMDKSLGNKRRRIGGKEDGERGKDYLCLIAKIYDEFSDGAKAVFQKDGKEKTNVVGKIFDNEDFGYRKVAVERPLRLNFRADPERIGRLKEEKGFINIALSRKKDANIRRQEEEAGEKRQEEILVLLDNFAKKTKGEVYKNRDEFFSELEDCAGLLKLKEPELKAISKALGERDESADMCTKKNGSPEFDPDLKDTELISLKEDVEGYLKREVYPHVPDAVADMDNIKIGYEIPFNKLFYVYEPPKPLEEIERDLRACEGEIGELLAEVAR